MLPSSPNIGSESIQVSPAAILNNETNARLNRPKWSGAIPEKRDTPRIASAETDPDRSGYDDSHAMSEIWISGWVQNKKKFVHFDVDLHTLKMIINMINAFIIGNSDAAIAENIFVSSVTRPKSRTTLKARISLTSQSGTSKGPKSTSDMKTTITSSKFHPLPTKA
jgi:hypothetical protein